MKRYLTVFAFTIAMASQAAAGGVLTFNFNAQNSNQANAIRSGLVLYQIYKDIDTNGHISQSGVNNLARLAQGRPETARRAWPSSSRAWTASIRRPCRGRSSSPTMAAATTPRVCWHGGERRESAERSSAWPSPASHER